MNKQKPIFVLLVVAMSFGLSASGLAKEKNIESPDPKASPSAPPAIFIPSHVISRQGSPNPINAGSVDAEGEPAKKEEVVESSPLAAGQESSSPGPIISPEASAGDNPVPVKEGVNTNTEQKHKKWFF